MRRKLFCPISRELSSISRNSAHTCATPSTAAEGPPPRPVPGPRRAAFPSLSSAVLRSKFFAQSHTFSRHLSQSLVHLSCLSTPSTAPKMLLTSIPFETGTLPANQTTVSWPSRLPLRHTQYEIRNSAPNLLLPPCKSLDHRISCTHSRKPKAAADHLCTLTNVYGLTEHTQLQDHNAAAPDATRCAHPQNFFGESKATHEFTRHFAPIRATLILTARTDRIQSRASHEFMQHFDPLCACAPPAATTPAAFTQPPVCRDA